LRCLRRRRRRKQRDGLGGDSLAASGEAQALGRLGRLHHAFGEALREEQMSRELDLLDP
jgi:hypothetical protein